jgi:hypothetical protein
MSNYKDLQRQAKEVGIAANQSKAVLEKLLGSPTVKNTMRNAATPPRR